MNLIHEEKRKAHQSREVRGEFRSTLIEVENWLSRAAQATAHHKDDVSDETSKTIKVRLTNRKKEKPANEENIPISWNQLELA